MRDTTTYRLILADRFESEKYSSPALCEQHYWNLCGHWDRHFMPRIPGKCISSKGLEVPINCPGKPKKLAAAGWENWVAIAPEKCLQEAIG